MGYPDLQILFLGQWTEKTNFFEQFLIFFLPNFPMKLFKEGQKFLHDGSCINRNFHFFFEGIPFIFVVMMKKKTIYCLL